MSKDEQATSGRRGAVLGQDRLRHCWSREEGHQVCPGVCDLGGASQEKCTSLLKYEGGWSRKRGLSKSVTLSSFGWAVVGVGAKGPGGACHGAKPGGGR